MPKSFDFSSAPAGVYSLDMSRAPSAVTGIDLSGLPSILRPENYAAERKRIEDSLYGRQAEVLDRRFDRERDREENRLLTQGLRLGSEAYGNAVSDFNRDANDAYAAALAQAVAQGGQEFDRAFGSSVAGRQQGYTELAGNAALQNAARGQTLQEQLANAGLANAGRQQSIAEQLQAWQMPLQQLQGVKGLNTVFGMPNMGGTAQYQVAPADYAGAMQNNYLAQQNAYNQQVGANNAAMGGFAGLAGSVASAAIPLIFSDERAKEDREPASTATVLDIVRDLPSETWSYKPEAAAVFGLPGGRHVGPMAQDFKRITGAGDGTTIPTVDAMGMLFASVKELANRLDKRKAA